MPCAHWNMYFVFHSKMFAGEVMRFTTFICLLMIPPLNGLISLNLLNVCVWREELSSNTFTHNYTLLLTHTRTLLPLPTSSHDNLLVHCSYGIKPYFFSECKSLTAGVQIGGRDVGLWQVWNPPEFLFTGAVVFTQRTTIFQSEVFILVDQASNLGSRLN